MALSGRSVGEIAEESQKILDFYKKDLLYKKRLEAFGMIAADPGKIFKFDESFKIPPEVKIGVDTCHELPRRDMSRFYTDAYGSMAASVGGESDTLTADKLKKAIDELRGKIYTSAPIIKRLFCSRHEDELPDYKKKILEYKNKFKKIQPISINNALNVDNGCIACRLKYK